MVNYLNLLNSILFIHVIILHTHFSYATMNRYNVLYFGAKPNGITNSTQAFLDAWAAACDSDNSAMIYVPKGRYLLLGSMEFNGDSCKSPGITIRIDGTLMAPADYGVLGESDHWLSFHAVSNVSIVGGALDARGSSLWACKSANSTNCPSGVTSLRFTNSNNIMINRLMSLNSQMFHIVINQCEDVHIEGMKVLAAGDSPNTDGIHIQSSTNVEILNSTIKTGDDCISIGPGTTNLWINRVTCGPGHGISIGSLGRDLDEEGVENVTVTNTIFRATQNGFRIKSWSKPSNGFVDGVKFIGARMQSVTNPIIIDQNYCPHNTGCPNKVSGVKISNVTYQDITGTSTKQVAIEFDCSPKYPCTGIRLQNLNLTYSGNDQVADKNQVADQTQSSCSNVVGEAYGLVQPNSCL